MTDQPAPYAAASPTPSSPSPAPARVRIPHLQKMKARGEKWAMLTAAVSIPTVGIGAGNCCDAQVLVWQEMAGLRTGRLPRFVKQYADLRTSLLGAVRDYAADVAGGTFPGPEHTF